MERACRGGVTCVVKGVDDVGGAGGVRVLARDLRSESILGSCRGFGSEGCCEAVGGLSVAVLSTRSIMREGTVGSGAGTAVVGFIC